MKKLEFGGNLKTPLFPNRISFQTFPLFLRIRWNGEWTELRKMKPLYGYIVKKILMKNVRKFSFPFLITKEWNFSFYSISKRFAIFKESLFVQYLSIGHGLLISLYINIWYWTTEEKKFAVASHSQRPQAFPFFALFTFFFSNKKKIDLKVLLFQLKNIFSLSRYCGKVHKLRMFIELLQTDINFQNLNQMIYISTISDIHFSIQSGWTLCVYFIFLILKFSLGILGKFPSYILVICTTYHQFSSSIDLKVQLFYLVEFSILGKFMCSNK